MPEKKGPSQSMKEWASAVGDISHDQDKEDLIRAFKRSRADGYAAIKELNLPTFESTRHADLTDFLEQFDTYIPDEKKHQWFVLLEPKDKLRDERIRRIGLEKSDIKEFVSSALESAGATAEEFNVTWAEDHEHKYGGNIIIKKDGSILVEFIPGNQGDVAGGTFDPKDRMTVTRDQFLKTFKYSFEDESLREKMFDTIMRIPHTGKNRDMEFVPGYYEFMMVERDEKKGIEPIFIDYHGDDVFIK